jgi:hypothetical protein
MGAAICELGVQPARLPDAAGASVQASRGRESKEVGNMRRQSMLAMAAGLALAFAS